MFRRRGRFLPAPDHDPGAPGRRRLRRFGYRWGGWPVGTGSGGVTVAALVPGPVAVCVIVPGLRDRIERRRAARRR